MTLAHRHEQQVAAGILGGRYELTEVLAIGGGGTVWLGHHRVLSRPVAVKEVACGGTARTALREARAAAAVRHPNVVDVHDVVVDPSGSGWIVMEALDGEPLHASILRRGRISVLELLNVAHGLTEALHALHSAGVLHRDVKPSNVHRCGSGRTVLTDLGVATRLDQHSAPYPDAVAGTLRYLAPEIVLDGRATPASDLYALGATLFCAAEGTAPFPIDCVQDLVDHAHRMPPPPPSPHAGPLTPVLAGLLQPRPADRWTVADVRAHLSALAGRRWPAHVLASTAAQVSGAPVVALSR